MNQHNIDYELYSKFPRYGWIFPCSRCHQPTFRECSKKFICKHCKLQTKNCCKQQNKQINKTI